MSKRHFSLLIGLMSQAGCLVYDDSRLRPPADAAAETVHDAVTPSRDAPRDIARDVALGQDVFPNDVAIPSDTGSDKAIEGDAADASDRDVRVEPDGDATDPRGDDGGDASTDPPVRDGDVDPRDVNVLDAGADNVIVGCPVGFTVSNITWDMRGSPGDGGWDGGERSVRIAGNVASLGAWDPALGVTLIETAPGTWFVAANLQDEVEVQFKFVKLFPGYLPEWESWTPFDSNRALRVDCSAEGGTVQTDGGPAVGRAYGGAFGVRPVDATK